ncbi:GOLD-like protein [Artemisia annua]|uniref:GOLD-like protein n=1 Tax=Artemisia annua TaxID=35608 RepID=A0A2U1N5C3_ARTAN|nr:GOLD-like protein [Artemisia annua]
MAASTNGLVPITRAFLSSYYDKYPFPPISDDVTRLSDHLHTLIHFVHFLFGLDESSENTSREPFLRRHKEHLDICTRHVIFANNVILHTHLLTLFIDETLNGPVYFKSSQRSLKCKERRKIIPDEPNLDLESIPGLPFIGPTLNLLIITYSRSLFQLSGKGYCYKKRNLNHHTKWTRTCGRTGSTLKKSFSCLKALIGRNLRRQLSQLGSATGVYKTLVKYLVGVPQVLLDFIRQINDDHGPMEEQRQRYGPPLYALTKMVLNIRLYLSLSWWHYEDLKLQKNQISILEEAVQVYVSELERFLTFIGEVFANSPFFVTAEEAGAIEGIKNDGYSETTVAAGKTHEDIGFSVEHTSSSGQKTLILPYRRCESDQGNFCTLMAGNYKLIWDNSYSTFFKKALRYKVDCIPPVVEPVSSTASEAAETG